MSTDQSTSALSPYRGLEPFDESERKFFFGRSADIRIITNNLATTRITILYGESGTGKSSVLMAGVIPYLSELPDFRAINFRSWQHGDAFAQLKAHIAASCGIAITDPDEELRSLLKRASEHLDVTLALLLDQFEEYFLYHCDPKAIDIFDAELARAINDPQLAVNFLLSIREDAISLLDRFRRRVPYLTRNILRLDHLSIEAAREAVCRPLEIYRECCTGSHCGPVSIEEALVETLTGPDLQRKAVSRRGEGPTIETPLLQLVLTRLWEAERDNKSTEMRQVTLDELGSPQRVIQTHLDQVMSGLSKREQNACERFFDRLVTPSHSKIAFTVRDAKDWSAGYAELIPPLLKKLVEHRILRNVSRLESEPNEQRFEITHDVLGPAVLNWQKRQIAQAARRRRHRLLGRIAAATLLVFAVLLAYAHSLWVENRPWGEMTDLQTGESYAVFGEQFTIGRTVPGSEYKNNISIPGREISRIHFMLFRDNEQAVDVRSLFGTTINARYLPYGTSRQLKEGDVLVLSGMTPFHYRRIRYSGIPFVEPALRPAPPADTSALIVDGNRRLTLPLSFGVHYVSRGEAGLTISDREPDAPHARVNIAPDQWPTIRASDHADNLMAMVKSKLDDRHYVDFTLGPNDQIDCFVNADAKIYRMSPCDYRDRRSFPIYSATFTLQGQPFQIVQWYDRR